MSSQTETIPRRHDLDALRAAAMLLGIGLHAALSFTQVPWLVSDSRQNAWFGLFIAAVHGFRMPLFFLLSGFFTAMLWQRRGLKALIRQRFQRVFLPLMLGLVTVVPLVNLAGIVVSRNPAPSGSQPPAKAPAPESPAPTPAPDTSLETSVPEAPDLWAAAIAGNVEALQARLAGGADVNGRHPQFGATALSLASLYGQTEAARALIEAGADVNLRNADGATGLHGAMFLGRAEIVRLLLDAGADTTLRSNQGANPVDGLGAPWGMTQGLANLLGVTVVEDEVMSGRERVRAMLGSKGSGRNWKSLLNQLMFKPLFHHLWFLWFLCWLVAGFALVALLAGRLPGASVPGWLVNSPLRYAWLIPLTMVPQWFMGREYGGFGPATSTGLIPMPQVLAYYAIFFGFGSLYYLGNDAGGKVGRWWWLTLPAALVVALPLGIEFSSGVFGFRDQVVHPDQFRIAAVAVQVAYAWLMTFACMGVFRKLMPGESRAIRYVSDSSYWLYLAHLPLVIFLQWVIREWEFPALLKFLLLCAVVSGFLLLVYATCVRYHWLGRLLNGPRERPAKGIVPATVTGA